MLSRRSLFLGLGAVVVAGGSGLALRLLRNDAPAPLAEIDERGRLLWKNWSGIQTAYPEQRWAPQSEDELISTLATKPMPWRVVGAGHSFMPLVPTEGTLITLDALTGVISHDAQTNSALIHAGTRLGDLGPALAAVNQEMPNLPDINKQSLAGALATGTHGTGRAYKAMHGQVERMRIVTARGEVLECDAQNNAELFNAARVGLGAFGIVTQVQMRNQPLERIHKRTYVSSLEQAISQWPSLVSRHRNVEFYAVPFTGLAAVITADETDQPVRPRGPDQDAQALMDLKRLRDLFGFSSGLRRRIAHSMMADLPPEEAIDEGWKLLSNERPVRFNEMEFHLPLEQQMRALREVIDTIETQRPDVFFPIEVRVIEADDAWLSPFYERLSGSIAVHAYYEDDYEFLHELIEPIFRRHGGRPHWGKLNSLQGSDFASLYPRWNEAMKVREGVDPEGRFLNDYLRRLAVGG